MSTTNDNDTTRNPCTTCDDLGEVRSQRMTPEAVCDLEPCPDCHGGDAAHPAEWERVGALLGALGLSPRGYDDARAEAKRITHRIGVAPSAPEVPQLLEVIEALGYHRLAAAIAEHVVPVTVTVANDNDDLVVSSSRVNGELFEKYVDAMREVPGRRWDGARKANVVPVRSMRALWEALKGCLPKGAVIVGARVSAVA